jgi:hypothetical protein
MKEVQAGDSSRSLGALLRHFRKCDCEVRLLAVQLHYRGQFRTATSKSLDTLTRENYLGSSHAFPKAVQLLTKDSLSVFTRLRLDYHGSPTT